MLIAAALLLAACVETEIVDETIPERIDLTPATAAAKVGDTVQFQAFHYDSSGSLVTSPDFDWTSSDPTIASIDATGLATALKEGQVAIRAESGDLASNAALLTIVTNSDQPASIEVAPASAQVSAGGTVQFTATVRNLSGDPIAGAAVSWRSSSDLVATIDGSGLATALSPGRVQVTATAGGIDSPPATLDVLGQTRSGTFVSANHYTVRGTASLEQTTSGGLVVQLGSDYISSAGPGLYVFLSRFGGVSSSASLSLAPLRSTSGAQTYTVPTGVGLYEYDYVVIHCVPFNVTFGHARLN